MAWYSDLSSEEPKEMASAPRGSEPTPAHRWTPSGPAPVAIPIPPPLQPPPAGYPPPPAGSQFPAEVPSIRTSHPLDLVAGPTAGRRTAPLIATALMVTALMVAGCAFAVGRAGTGLQATSARIGSSRTGRAGATGLSRASAADSTTTSSAPTTTAASATPDPTTAPTTTAAPPSQPTPAAPVARPAQAPAQAPKAPSWDEIKDASIPGLCGHPPTRLVEGRDVTLPERSGYFQLLPIIDHGAAGRGPGFVSGLPGPSGPVTAVVGSCNGGGVSWPNIIVVFGPGGVFYGTHDLMTGIDWGGAGMTAPGRDGVTSITQAGGRLVVDTSAEYAMEPSCCPSGFATITLAVVDHGLAAVDFQPSTEEVGC